MQVKSAHRMAAQPERETEPVNSSATSRVVVLPRSSRSTRHRITARERSDLEHDDQMSTTAKRPRLSDVADKAHVSKTAASMILRGLGKFDDRTRASVYAAAKELGYRPDMSARYLSSSERMPIVAVVFSELPAGYDAPQMFWTLALNSTIHGLLRNSISTLVVPTINELDGASLPIEAILLVTSDPKDFESPFLASMDVPLIVAGVQRQNEPGPGESPVTAWAHTDSYLMSEMALDHLAERGSTRPAVLFGEVPMAMMDDLRIGAEHWFNEAGLEPLIFHSGDLGGFTTQCLEQGADSFVVLCSDHRAKLEDVLRSIASSGKSVPDDVMVVALSQFGRAPYVHPSVTTVWNDGPAIGNTLANMIANGLKSGDFESIEVMPSVTQRESTSR